MSDHGDHATAAAAYARLLSLAVHEFRTPASVVGGYLRMLQRDSESPLSERQRKMIEEAEKSCGRIVGLITELSEISKLDSGTAAVKDEVFDLFELAGEVASTVHESEDREVRLQVRGGASGAPVRGDAERVRNALDTIFRAVLREQPSSTLVAVDRRIGHQAAPAPSAVIVVARTDDVQAAYDAAPGAFDEKRGGLGLALPIARRVIERFGGRLWSPRAQDGDTEPSRGAIMMALPLVKS